MTVGLLARITAAFDPVFLARVAEAVDEAAVAIYNEANTVNNHAIRAAYATKVLNAPRFLGLTPGASAPGGADIFTVAFAAALVTQGLDNSDSSAAGDTAIANGVAGVWNALAGA